MFSAVAPVAVVILPVDLGGLVLQGLSGSGRGVGLGVRSGRGGLLAAAGSGGKDHTQDQQDGKQLLHEWVPP